MNTNRDKRPNILWVCTDQQRFDTLGCYGNPYVHTPNLDALAASSVFFEQAYCQSPVCTPSRASFLTGRYPVTARGRQNGADIPDSEVLVTRLLKDHGYTCGLSGKLHLSACNPQSGCTTMERRIDDGYDEFHWSHDTAPVWGLHNEYYRWLADQWGTSYKTTPRQETTWVQDGMPEEQHQTTWCAQKAIEFMRQHADDGQPWLFSVNMYDPHHPFDPPKSYLDRYLSCLDGIPLPKYVPGEENDKPIWQRQDHTGAYNHHAGYPFSEMTELDHRMVKAAYWAMCDLIDAQVGRMITVLKETGQWENTIVIFMSDHGELLGDHGIYLKGPFFYDCSIHVPLLISWPNMLAPQRVPSLVALMDLPQTLLELCNLPPYDAMQGKSMVPLLQDPTNLHRDHVFCEYLNAMPWHTEPKAFASMVRTQQYKLVVSHALPSEGELYDLSVDPSETHNVYHHPEYTAVKLKLMELLLHDWASTADPLPKRKSDW
ncbi:sulfatase family protein [Sphaerochaeta sp.]|uniref:sulfatase family protein n=1 Tax=Sphaerochaeta sp. TaxID=1972642 RepID=UPI002FCA9860